MSRARRQDMEYRAGRMRPVKRREVTPQLRVKWAITVSQPRASGIFAQGRIWRGISPCRLLWCPRRPPIDLVRSGGWVAIHSHGSKDDAELRKALSKLGVELPEARPFNSGTPTLAQIPQGAIVGVVRLTSWTWNHCDPGDPWAVWWRAPRHADHRVLALSDAIPFHIPVRASGQPNWWAIPEPVGREVYERTKGVLPKAQRRDQALYFEREGRIHRDIVRPDDGKPLDIGELDQTRVVVDGRIVLASEAMYHTNTHDPGVEIYS